MARTRNCIVCVIGLDDVVSPVYRVGKLVNGTVVWRPPAPVFRRGRVPRMMWVGPLLGLWSPCAMVQLRTVVTCVWSC